VREHFKKMKYKNLIINELGKKCNRQLYQLVHFVFQSNFIRVSTFCLVHFVLLEHIYINTYFD